MTTAEKGVRSVLREFVSETLEKRGDSREFWAKVRSIQQGDPTREIRNMGLVLPPGAVIRGSVRSNITYMSSRDALVFTSNMISGSGRESAITRSNSHDLGWSIGQMVSPGEAYEATYRSASKLVMCLVGATDDDEFRGHLRRVSARLRSAGVPVNPVRLVSDLYGIYHGIRSGEPSETLYDWAASFEKSSDPYTKKEQNS